MAAIDTPLSIAMRRLLNTSVLLALWSFTVGCWAQEPPYSSPEAAITGLFPLQNVDEWVYEQGDLNGDGIPDRAMILTHSPGNGPFETYLVILAGAPGGQHVPLSVSTQYCDARKFFNLVIKGSSLYVQAVLNLSSDSSVTNTLQFRYNKKRADLELIGAENLSESFNDESSQRISTNYRTGTVIHYAHKQGRTRQTQRSRFQPARLALLNGFDCARAYVDIPPQR